MSSGANNDLGTLERRDDGMGVLRYQRHLAHPPEKVWEALTAPAQLAGWFPTTVDGARKPGAPLRFRFEKAPVDPMTGQMLTFDPPALLEFHWGDDHLRFELSEESGGTRLDFTVTFPQFGKAARDGAGWHVCLDNLPLVLDQQGPEPEEWRAVHPRYVESFGEEASSVGVPPELESVHGID
jgi:uncharacterized protein YndB with AHSA1/START domain